MKIGGYLRYLNNHYYISMTETKNKVSWYLVSEYHEDDIKVKVTGGLPTHTVLTDGLVMRKPIPKPYVVEAVERAKTSGKTLVYRRKNVLSEVIDTINLAMAYNFDPSRMVQERKDVQGISVVNKEARDDNMYFKYTRVNSAHYTHLELKYRDIELYLSEEWNVRIPTKQLESELKQIKTDGKGKAGLQTIKSLTYDELKQLLDLSFYEENGVIKKDYRAITSKQEFEKYVMEPLMAEYQACLARGEQLVFGCDTETTGLIFCDLSIENEELDRLVAIPLSWKDDQGVVVFVDMEYFKNVELEYVLDRLRPFLEAGQGNIKIEKRDSFNTRMRNVAQMHSFGSEADNTDDDEETTWEVTGDYQFNRDDILLVGHNILFDGRVFYHYGIKSKWNDDTLQMAFNLNPKVAKGSNKLKNLTRRIFGHETPELSDILGKGNEGNYRLIQDLQVAVLYGCADTDYTRLVHKHLRSLMSPKMLKTYRRQDVDIMNILYRSEYHGMTADEVLLKDRAKIVEEDLKLLKEFMYNYVGVAVRSRNTVASLKKELEIGKITQSQYDELVKIVGSDAGTVKDARYEFELKGSQIRRVLYDILEYPIYSWTKGEKNRQPSVDKFAMKKLQSFKWKTPTRNLNKDILSTDQANEWLPDKDKIKLIEAEKFNESKYPMAYVLAKYGELNKEWTSYYEPLRKQNLEGKIFKGYSLARIETRRIMNPGQTMKGDLKALIKPYNDDYYLCDFDQSQVEYRIMASLAKFEDVIRKMNNPEKDYHTETASQVHGKAAHEITKYLRKQTKGISFGVPYGLGDHKMSENLFGDSGDESLTKTRFMLHDYKKANKPIIDMLNKYKANAIKPIKLEPAMQKFIKVKEEDPDDIPYGKVEGVMGFYRLFDLRDLDNKKIGKIQRPAGNYPIQNFAAELFRMILLRFHERCVAEGIDDKIIWHMTIHDELLFSVHKSIHPFYLYKLLFESCVVQIKGHCKYYIGINIGDSWADCKEDKNEAPIMFVERIVKRWDAGEFRDDPYQDNVKAYVLKHKQDYIVQRIHEVIKGSPTDEALQADIDDSIIDIPLILQNFSNYTVRSYITDFFSLNTPVLDKKDENQIWLSKFESWVLAYYGEGREAKYPDGSVRTIMKDDTEVIELEFETENDDDGYVEDYWSFDENDIGDSQEELYATYEDEISEEEAFFNSFDRDNKEATTVAGLWMSKGPTYKNIEILNGQLILKIPRQRHIGKLKSYLLDKQDNDGYSVTFETPIDRDSWSKVSKSVDLEELDKFIGTLN